MSSQQTYNETAARPRLGDILIKQDLLNRSQLEEAIEYQSIYGGRLGTSLIELGLVDEYQMAKALSRQLKIRHIKPHALMKVPKEIINLVSSRLALKHKLVPYHKKGRKLYVAINDVCDLGQLDSLSFQLNHIVIPLVVPEVRLLLALKKYYGMMLTPRYETIAAQLNRRHQAQLKSKQSDSKNQTTKPAVETQQPSTDGASWPLLGDKLDEPDDLIQYEVEAKTESGSDQQQSLAETCRRLAEATDRDDIGRAVLDSLEQDFPHSALFVVREQIANGWMISGRTESDDFNQRQIDLSEDSVLQTVTDSMVFYLGGLTDTPTNRCLVGLFGTNLPQSTLAIPISVKNRLVGLLYVQGTLLQLEKKLVEIQQIVGKAEMAFRILILKNKILNN